MPKHIRPYRPKKKYQKEGKARASSPIMAVEVRNDDVMTVYSVKVSSKKCSKCHCQEYGRVFKVVGIAEVYNLDDFEPMPKHEGYKNQGKTLCLDCLS
jgi:hypothetical protein